MQSTLVRDLVAATNPQDMQSVLAADSRPLRVAFGTALVEVARIVDVLPQMDDFRAREQAILAVTTELARRLIERDLQRIADSFPAEITVRGERYRRHLAGTVAYHTLCGDVIITRDTFRLVGVHNGPTIVALDLASGLVFGASPALAYSIAHDVANMNSRAYVETMHAAGRRPPSRSTVTRLANAIGNCCKQDVEQIEAFVRATEPLPPGAHAVVVGLDRTTVPMAEEVPRETAVKPARTKPYVRTPPQPVEVKYRMAYVGTVAVVDRDGEMLRTVRFGATSEEGPDELVRRMMAEVQHLRAQADLDVAIIQDGAPELWGLMWDGLRSIGVKKWTQAIDYFHVVEHMNAALDAAPVANKEEIRERFIRAAAHSDRAVWDFAKWLKKNFASTRAWREIRVHHTYFWYAHLGRMTRYATMRRLGLPIGSGVTEGACKSLIAKRFKGGGEKWKQDGLTAILTLRALRLSARLPAFWSFFRNRFRTIIEC